MVKLSRRTALHRVILPSGAIKAGRCGAMKFLIKLLIKILIAIVIFYVIGMILTETIGIDKFKTIVEKLWGWLSNVSR